MLNVGSRRGVTGVAPTEPVTLAVPDPRCYPIVDLDRALISEMLRPILAEASVREIARVEGGLVNTLYRVTLGRQSTVLALRVSPRPGPALAREAELLSDLSTVLPVPEPLWVDGHGERCGHPYMIYRWIPGITLNELRRRASLGEWLSVAEPLGLIVGAIARTSLADGPRAGEAPPVARRSAEREVRQTRARLCSGIVRARLGSSVAWRLDELLARHEERLAVTDRAACLVHGDLGGRNILVRDGGARRWEIAGVIDWECAAAGSPLWDPGSLFRYASRYGPEFRKRFERGYRAAGVDAPTDWWRPARLLDATRLVGILAGEATQLASVFAECRDQIRSLLQAAGGPPGRRGDRRIARAATNRSGTWSSE